MGVVVALNNYRLLPDVGLSDIVEDVNSGNYYRAMKTCKVLMNYEDEMLKVGKKAAQLEATDGGD